VNKHSGLEAQLDRGWLLTLVTAFSVRGHGVYPKSVSGDGPRRTPVRPLWVSVSLGSTLLVIGAVVAAVGLANLFVAARRPLAWAAAAAVAAWLLSGVVDIFGRWVPRGVAVLMTVLGLVLVAGGGWVGVRATLAAEVDELQTALPAAAGDLETRFRAAADFNLAERTRTFVNDLDDRFGIHAQLTAAAGTASAYLVSAILMLFLLGYGPRFLSAALRQIADPARRAAVTAVVDQASPAARAYLLIVLLQAIVITAVCSSVFYLLDLPAPFVLGLIVGWLSAIPYFGILLGGLAPLLVAVTEPHLLTYLVLAALLVGLQSVDVFVVRPRADRSVRVGPALMLAGILIGFELYGFGGALYGTALLVLFWAVLCAMPDRSTELPVGDDPGTAAPTGGEG
jgi:putative heme transporter